MLPDDLTDTDAMLLVVSQDRKLDLTVLPVLCLYVPPAYSRVEAACPDRGVDAGGPAR